LRSEPTDPHRPPYLKRIHCRKGEDCIYWMEGCYCDYPGIIVIGGKRTKCLHFKQDFNYRREQLKGR